MRATRRMQITIETDQVTVIRRRHSTRTWCGECGSEVDVVRIEEAGVLIGMTQPVLRDYAKAQRWHLCEAADGSLLICLDSLLRSL